ncbi:ABC transporter ATP-binding protein [Occultella kanbiaonis]|uniref:ABC transporter ATP-binding protein n=1 Tax=Occultella kanbiaonis TaxID=2675754 RepID=UPI0012B7005A|nr:ABC transporter ATP-binding protein [Occultella kanbiaonis]
MRVDERPTGAPAPGTRTGPLLRVQDLSVSFATGSGRLRAVDGVSFDVGAGETVAVLGESGSGKSVTAQTVMGLLPRPAGRIDGGRICFDGVDLLDRPDSYTRALCGTEIAMIFQDPLSSLNPVFRVGTQIGETLRRRRGVSRRKAREHAVEMMHRVGIPAPHKRVDDYPHQFSGGMRQRVMIAMALSMNPRLVIADEPTTALDVTVQAQIMSLLADLQREEGMALVLITHDLGVVADVADRAVLMYAGRVVETGPIREVYDHGAHPYSVGLMGSLPTGDQDRLIPITGAPPDLRQLPTGCSFHPRCAFATDLCRTEEPALRAAPDWPQAHRTACHHAEEVLVDGLR